MKKYNTFFTDDEQELFNILISLGVDAYVSILDRTSIQNDDIGILKLGLKEVGEVLSKLDFDVEINIKEIEIL